MHIEVLICTHNRSWLLKSVLISLNNTYKTDGARVSLTIMANACTDDTEQLLRTYQDETEQQDLIPLKWFDVPTPGKSHALNYAIPKLEGDLIALIDDDHRISRNYFRVLEKAALENPQIPVFFGKILPDWTGKEPDWAHVEGQYAIYPLPVPCYDKGDEPFEFKSQVSIPGGGNLALKKEVFDKVGFFNIELGPSGHNLGGAEDGDFVQRALSKGIKLRYIPEMVQYHYVDLERFTLKYVIEKSFQRSKSVVLIRHADATRIPMYLWKKLVLYISSAVFSFNLNKIRFYLVRIAATLGEISGFGEIKKGYKH